MLWGVSDTIVTMIEVIPAILEKDFAQIESKIKLVEGLVSWVQIDMADGVLVPNTVLHDAVQFSKLKTSIHRELHLMVKDPLRYLEPFVKAGFARFYAHVEADTIDGFIAACYRYDVEVGLAIDGPTPVEKLQPYMDNVDCVLVMAINAGFSGQPYREDTTEKIRIIHDWSIDTPIAVDGAMSVENAAKVVAAGATRICTNSYLFNAPDLKEAIEKIRNLDSAEQQ